MIGTIVVFKQLSFIQTKKLGFNKEQVLIVDGTGALGNNNEAFRNEVKKMPGIIGASHAGYLPVPSSRSDNSFFREAVLDAKEGMNMQVWGIDYDYIQIMGMEIIKGRGFSRDYGTDSNALVINETTAALLGYTDPIGKKLYTPDFPDQSKILTYEIIGVVKNFHFESLRQNIGALCFRLGNSGWSTAFKVSTTDLQGLIKNIENKWRSMSSSMPFSYRFLDEAFTNMYRDELRVGKVAFSFAILAILIACLGLFGLATYMAEQRIKEIGVRKVLGASVNHIVSMLSKDFLKLVAIAAVIAFPVAWWIMHNWLQDFAFRINISWWFFVAAGTIALLIALVTVSFQAIKAALMNPVNSLRTE
jgi:putative ABC transport system permease protein